MSHASGSSTKTGTSPRPTNACFITVSDNANPSIYLVEYLNCTHSRFDIINKMRYATKVLVHDRGGSVFWGLFLTMNAHPKTLKLDKRRPPTSYTVGIQRITAMVDTVRDKRYCCINDGVPTIQWLDEPRQ